MSGKMNVTAFKKFNRDQWKKVEVKLTGDFITSILNEMILLGNDNQIEYEKKTKTIYFCGEDIYSENRNLLEKENIVDGILDIKKKKIIIKKKDQIIANNIQEQYKKNLIELIDNLKKNPDNLKLGFNSKYGEIKLITLMYYFRHLLLIKSTKKNTNQNSMSLLDENDYELIVGTIKIIKNLKDINNLSSLCLKDLELAMEKLKKKIKFSYENVFKYFPRMCIITKYDNVFPSLNIKPYTSQIQLMHDIKTHSKGLYLYNSTIGSGKTTVSIAIAKYIEKIRLTNKGKNLSNNLSHNAKYDNLMKGNKIITNKNNIIRQAMQQSFSVCDLQLIFTCCVEAVRYTVCNYAYTAEIPFGIATLDEVGNIKISNNYICKNDSSRILIVADLDTTYELLRREKESKGKNYILFIDEPTYGADIENHPVTKMVARILTVCPDQTILSSATLPDKEFIFKNFNNLYEESNIFNIHSKEALIGCEVTNFDGEKIIPHHLASNRKELLEIMQVLMNKPFLDRLYSPNVVFNLYNDMKQILLDKQQSQNECIFKKIITEINFDEYFSEKGNLTQPIIQNLAMILLKNLSEQDDDIINKICQQKNTKSNPEEFYKDIFYKNAHKFMGGCLIAVNNPLEFVLKYGAKIISEVGSAYKLIEKYESSKNKYDLQINKINYIKNEDEKLKKIQQFEQENLPKIDFPDSLRINSYEHFRKYNEDETLLNANRNFLQHDYDLDSLPLDLKERDELLILLFAGIGIYGTNLNLSKDYCDLVLHLTQEKKLAFLITDASFSYGANYPFNHVIISDDLANNHSIGTIFQLLGRAGRVGQSWIAHGYTDTNTSQRIKNYILNNEKTMNVEGQNLANAFIEALSYDPKEDEMNRMRNSKMIKLSQIKKIEK